MSVPDPWGPHPGCEGLHPTGPSHFGAEVDVLVPNSLGGVTTKYRVVPSFYERYSGRPEGTGSVPIDIYQCRGFLESPGSLREGQTTYSCSRSLSFPQRTPEGGVEEES